jgi:hypothetical protein
VTTIRQLILLSILILKTHMVIAVPQPPQAPPEKRVCKLGEILVEDKCIPKPPLPPEPHDPTAMAGPENPGGTDDSPHPTIPRCQRNEVLIDGKCVRKVLAKPLSH